MKSMVRPHKTGAGKIVGSIAALVLNNQKLRQIYLVGCALLSVTFSACGQSSIAKRWQVAGRLENGKLTPHKSKTMDYEFTGGGRFNLYENGAITETGTYTLASDKKSVLIKEDGRGISGTIIKLTATELNIRFKGSSDTIICYAMGSAASNKAQKSAETYRNAGKLWVELQYQYSRRNENVSALAQNLQYLKDNPTKKFYYLVDLVSSTHSFYSTIAGLTKEKYQEYEAIEEKIRIGKNEMLAFVKENYPNLTGMDKSKTYYEEQIEYFNSVEAEINKQRDAFEKAFNK